MKKFLMALVAAACALGAYADGDWKTTLGKVKDFSGDMGFMAFMKREAPAYITGNFAEAERPEKKPMSAAKCGFNLSKLGIGGQIAAGNLPAMPT